MKQTLLFSLLSISMLTVNSQLAFIGKDMFPPDHLSFGNSSQPGQEQEKMSAVVFRSQLYCRAEVKDFEFEAPFTIVSATVYFSGENFKNVEKGTLTSNSLKPIKDLMARCVPGSIVIFDNVQVIGPDKQLRSVPGPSLRLH